MKLGSLIGSCHVGTGTKQTGKRELVRPTTAAIIIPEHGRKNLQCFLASIMVAIADNDGIPGYRVPEQHGIKHPASISDPAALCIHVKERGGDHKVQLEAQPENKAVRQEPQVLAAGRRRSAGAQQGTEGEAVAGEAGAPPHRGEEGP
ncbi:hypothetical protein ACQJBY_002809 [Aegilops geniculata]